MMMKILTSLFILFLFLSCVSSADKKTPLKYENFNEISESTKEETSFQKFFLTSSINDKIFSLERIAEGKLLFICFSIKNCEPCKKLSFYAEKISERYKDKIKIIKIYSDKNTLEEKNENIFFVSNVPSDLEWNITEYPTVIIYSADGKASASFEGLYPILYYMSAIEDMLN